MKLMHSIKTLAVALLLAITTPAPSVAAQPAPTAHKAVQKSFATPEDAATALAEAVRAEDRNALLAVVGPTSGSWLFSGDAVADRADWKRFLAAYDDKHSITEATADKALLAVGASDWPFPAPLVRKADGWIFDAEAGKEEITNRRVGQNELDTIQTLLAIVDAQREYAVGDLDGNGYNDYARRFISSKGKKDGLFWPVQGDEPPSPLGPLVGEATRAGYAKGNGDQPEPYHGYYYRMLTAEGKSGPGGAYSYLVNDKMIGGFAVVAYPAKYGVSGVMTFMVNHDGVVYQTDLGKNTAAAALKMRSFNPDSNWTMVH